MAGVVLRRADLALALAIEPRELRRGRPVDSVERQRAEKFFDLPHSSRLVAGGPVVRVDAHVVVRHGLTSGVDPLPLVLGEKSVRR